MKKNNKTKIIQFEPLHDFVPTLMQPPKPSTQCVPNWYKNDTLFTTGNGDDFSLIKKGGIGTYKLCVPIVDSLTSGYTVTLSSAIMVENVSESSYMPRISWAVHWKPLEHKGYEGLSNYPIPFGHCPDFFRWITYWGIRTPKGYSTLITHPHQRHDLPFTTIGGVVDTDKHPNALQFPFFLKEGFEGIIEEGTPIAQILPFKRDDWKSESVDFDPKYEHNEQSASKIDFIRTYKNRWWSKKTYI
jgi:hypothetical protein